MMWLLDMLFATIKFIVVLFASIVFTFNMVQMIRATDDIILIELAISATVVFMILREFKIRFELSSKIDELEEKENKNEHKY